MSTLQLIEIVVGSVLAYTTGVGITAAFLGRPGHGPEWDHPAPFFWPLALPAMLAGSITDKTREAISERRKRKVLPKATAVYHDEE